MPKLDDGVDALLQQSALVAPDVLLLKDGGLLAGWEITGFDFDAHDPEAAATLRDRTTRILDEGRGWVVETNVIRQPVQGYPAWGVFPDPISQLIEDTRQQTYMQPDAYFETRRYLTVTYFPLHTATEKADGWFYDDNRETPGLAQEALDAFTESTHLFERTLSAFLTIDRLGTEPFEDEIGNSYVGSRLLRYVRTCIGAPDRPFLLPTDPIDLNHLLPIGTFVGGMRPSHGQRHQRILKIDPFPELLYAGALRGLELLPFPLRLHGRSILLDAHQAAKLHEDNRKRHNSKIHGLLTKLAHKVPPPNAPINPHALNMSKEAELAKSLTDDRKECWALHLNSIILETSTLEVMEERIKAILEVLERNHLQCRVEDVNAPDAWNGSLPGHAWYDLRQVPLRGYNIASTMPLHAVWTGHPYNPSPQFPPQSSPLIIATARGGIPYRHNLHVADVAHTQVIGPTGAGKTTIEALHAVQFRRYPGAKVFMFDRRRTKYVLCHALGGTYYDYGRDQSLRHCPLLYLNTESDRAWAANYIELLCQLNGLAVTATHRDTIIDAITRFSHRSQRSLTDFLVALRDRELAQAINFYTNTLLDGRDDSLSDSSFTVFEMRELMVNYPVLAVALQLHLNRRIERTLDTRHPTAVFVDEAKDLVNDARFAQLIKSWLTELRNSNGFVWLNFQLPEQILSSPLREEIKTQCPNRFWLPNPRASEPGIKQQYRDWGLNDTQIARLAAGEMKRDYFADAPGRFSEITFDLHNAALAFLGANSDEERDDCDEYRTRFGTEWPYHWLLKKNLPEWAEHYRALCPTAEEAVA